MSYNDSPLSCILNIANWFLALFLGYKLGEASVLKIMEAKQRDNEIFELRREIEALKQGKK